MGDAAGWKNANGDDLVSTFGGATLGGSIFCTTLGASIFSMGLDCVVDLLPPKIDEKLEKRSLEACTLGSGSGTCADRPRKVENLTKIEVFENATENL